MKSIRLKDSDAYVDQDDEVAEALQDNEMVRANAPPAPLVNRTRTHHATRTHDTHTYNDEGTLGRTNAGGVFVSARSFV